MLRPLILAAVVSAVLLSTVLITRRTVARARDGAVRGVGAGFVIAAREQLRRAEQLDPDALAEFLDEQRDEGLRYVAVARADGRILAEQGDAIGTSTAPGQEVVGSRIRLVQAQRNGRRVLVYEFEPQIANELASDARSLTWAALGASAAVIALAVWVSVGLRARERMQAELEQRRRLAALGEMSTVLAHELRNPLASLKGHAQLLVEMLDDPAEREAARAKAERVVGEAVRLEALTNDLLDFVRTGELRRTDVAPAALVRDAAAEVDARIDVVADAAPATWPLDEPRLRAALVNVLRNAVQASPAGGRVTATVHGGARLAIEIRDRGAGIPPGEESAIFEPFHTRREKGVGLGLAIARRVVEAHGGTIAASNHTDGGAVFRLEIP